MTAGCPNAVTPCCARCSTRRHIHCLPRAGDGRGSRHGAYEWPSDAGCVEPSSRSPGAWPWFCTGCGSTVASSAGARTAPPHLRLPEPAADSAGNVGKEITHSAPAEKCPHGDEGWGEFVMPAAPAADQRQRAPDRLYLPSFSSHHEAACADLEEKQEPRVASLAGAQKGDGMR